MSVGVKPHPPKTSTPLLVAQLVTIAERRLGTSEDDHALADTPEHGVWAAVKTVVGPEL